MKLFFSILFFLLFTIANAQKEEKFYDWQWHESEPASARFYGVIVKSDSGWHRQDYFLHDMKLQMDGVYQDEACKVRNGFFRYYNSNGNLQTAGVYANNKKQGLWISYYPDVMMADSVVYKDGNPVGQQFSWYDNGTMSDSAQYAADGSGVEVRWFDNGVPASAGRYSTGMKRNGKWQYFHKNGKLASIETYIEGTLTDKQYFDEAGTQLSDTANTDKVASFPGGLKAWGKYLSKQIYFPDQYRITNSDQAVVVISAVVDEEGNVTSINVDTPFYPQFDDIAVNAMRKSPKWIPAMEHNRRVRYAFRQPVIFSQQ